MSYNTFTPIITDGLVLYLDAANTKSYPGTGAAWTDLTPSRTSCTLSNMGSTGFTSLNGGVLIFDGIDDFGNVTFNVPNNSSFTVSFWMKYLSPSSSSRGVLTTWDTSWNGFGIAVTTTNLRSWTNNGAAGGMNWVPYSELYNVWSYVTLTYDFTNKTQYGYINGIFKISETLGTTITHSTLQIARGGQNGSTQLSNYPNSNLLLPNLTVHNRVLSALEILQNYNATKWRFLQP